MLDTFAHVSEVFLLALARSVLRKIAVHGWIVAGLRVLYPVPILFVPT